jgi:hypothetical protein
MLSDIVNYCAAGKQMKVRMVKCQSAQAILALSAQVPGRRVKLSTVKLISHLAQQFKPGAQSILRMC